MRLAFVIGFVKCYLLLIGYILNSQPFYKCCLIDFLSIDLLGMTALKVQDESLIRVLRVDDDASFLEVSEQILLSEGNFEIDSALSVDEAFKKMETKDYDAIVSDYQMPEKDGLEFLKQLRERRNQIPFILFTGKGREEVAIKALNLGADAYHDKLGSPEIVYGELSHSIRLVVDRNKAKQALVDSERRYRTLMDQAITAISIHDVEGRIVDANQQLCRDLGYTREELLKMSVEDVDSEAIENRKDFLLWQKVIAGEHFTFESTNKRKDGSSFPVEISLGPITIGKETFVMAIVRDITRRKKNEMDLKEKYDVLDKVGEGVGAGLAIIGRDYRVVWANSVLKSLGAGYNKKCYEIFAKSDKVCDDCGVIKVFEQNVPLNVHEYKTVNSNGETVWIELRATPLKDKNGNVTAALELAVPITERKMIEEKLTESEERYRGIVELSPYGIATANLEGVFTSVNKAVSDLTGFSEEEIVGKHFIELGALRTIDLPKFHKLLASVLRGENPPVYEFSFVRKDGSVREADARISLIEVKGKTVGIQLLLRDNTERKEAEELIRESEAKYRSLFEYAGDYIFVFEVPPDGVPIIRDANSSALKMHGYSRDELIGKPLSIIDKQIDPAFTKVFMKEISADKPFVFEAKHQRKDGSLFDVEASAIKMKIGNETLVVSIEREITERKKAEEAVKRSEEKFRNFADSLPEIVFEADAEGQLTFGNRKAFEIFGYSKEEIYKLNIFHFIAPEDLQRARENLKRRIQGQDTFREYMLVRKDGSRFPATIFSERIMNPDGKPALRGIIINLTELKKAEKKLSVLNEKLHIVGGLTRHDVGNKIAVVKSNVYLLKKRLGDNPELSKFIDAIDRAVNDADRLFEFSRLYEKIGSEEPKSINIEECFNEAIGLFADLNQIKIVNESKGLSVMADSLLRQLFYNLIENTLKHGEKTTQIKLSYKKEKDGVKLIYEDDGIGVPETDKLKIFVQVISSGKGTGLGLKFVSRMLEVYGWKITEEGTAGKGTKFVISIPETSVHQENLSL